MLNIVVIGTGSIALSRHIPCVVESENAHLYGVYNRTIEKAKKLLKNIIASFTNHYKRFMRMNM